MSQRARPAQQTLLRCRRRRAGALPLLWVLSREATDSPAQALGPELGETPQVPLVGGKASLPSACIWPRGTEQLLTGAAFLNLVTLSFKNVACFGSAPSQLLSVRPRARRPVSFRFLSPDTGRKHLLLARPDQRGGRACDGGLPGQKPGQGSRWFLPRL